jgi:hypothetical protein
MGRRENDACTCAPFRQIVDIGQALPPKRAWQFSSNE